ncbi:thiol oxidoreductase [Devosia epidermidihirudinis]|uniref:Thiol oxidoreductase n=1 Tax=Devosia epidermidihirudinis TaxID=1293439 RepID=A0A0F5Q7G7_9HYPH|nr:di-heme oxidoredictase family protein [Devosia epidermidihirudinis]KKC36576.1 thiol oxidoreductase [Devosia epidermidihirudinis]
MKTRLTVALVALLAGGLAFAQDKSVRSDLPPEDLARVIAVTAPTTDFSKPEPFENRPAGKGTTTKKPNADSFSHFLKNLTFEQEEQFKLGNALFRKIWVSSPSSTQASDGLGPLFNARGCQSCHIKDGRGHPPFEGQAENVSMFLRLSVPPGENDTRHSIDGIFAEEPGDPTYGTQLQDFAVPGLKAEGRMVIDYKDAPVTLGDGTVITLRHPTYSIADLNYGPLAENVMISPRIANPMIGLGLIEQIPAEDILALADPDDLSGDGISGKANYAIDPVTNTVKLGRFGWKAGEATIKAQSAAAFAGDIGISTPLVNKPYGDCTVNQPECFAMPNGEQERLGASEAPDPVLDLVTFYSQTVGVPERRNVDDPAVLRGKQAFYEAGCTSCHTPKFVTSRDAENPAHRFQLIWPYSDFLLHDMGEGLADHRPEGLANGFEWRTPPLWGIGLTKTVSGHTFFLHDGRARDLTEAILWHGGEAQAARDRFANMSKATRDDLIAFLESL